MPASPEESLFLALSHDLLIRLDARLEVVSVNAAATRLLGLTDEALRGRSLLTLVHPEDHARVGERWAAAEPGGAALELTTRLRAADNLYRSVELRCARSAAGELYVAAREHHADSVLRADLAEVRRVLAGVFECCQDYAMITDHNVTVTHSNRMVTGMAETTVGKPMLSFAAPEELEPMTRRVEQVLREGKTLAYETRARYPDGSLWDFSSWIGPVRDGARNVGVVLITRDVTAVKAAEVARRQAEQRSREYMVQLERSNRELERFATAVSQDLQEPLRKIQLFADRLRRKLGEGEPDDLERIRGAAGRMQALIDDLLVFSRLSTREGAHAQVDLHALARGVLSDLELRIEETGGAVRLGELPTIEADPLHMRQLLQNLIGNALKFARPDVPPVVAISAQVVPGSATSEALCRVTVADNGIGVDPKHHDRIFGIFERLHGPGEYEGTGVGLAICRKIVEQHHGSIEVGGVVDQGATFTFVLPMRQSGRVAQP